MWKMLEWRMSRCGLGNGPRPLIEEFERIKTNDVIQQTSIRREVRIRCVTQLDESQRILLERLGLKVPTRLGEPHRSSDSQRQSRNQRTNRPDVPSDSFGPQDCGTWATSCLAAGRN
jgi:hypothetical protein